MPASTRNQLHGTIKSIVSDKVMSEVLVETAAGTVTSVITTNSVKALRLKKGDAVDILVKATSVSLGKR
jgi:molybdopterin-binding protein